MPARVRRRYRRINDPEALRRLYESWRVMHDCGLPTGFGGLVRQSVRQIAGSSDYTEQHVRRGIARARRLREAVADALDTRQPDAARGLVVCPAPRDLPARMPAV